MIRPLRTTHRTVFLALAFLLPVLFVSGVLSRRALPMTPSPNGGPTMASVVTASEQTVILNGTKFDLLIFGDKTNQTGLEIQIIPGAPLVAPDVLVYWSNTKTKLELSADAVFLGTFDKKGRYRLPASAQGYVVLYSLATKQVLGSIAIGARP